ncbi:hypothetical protein SDC9_193130 [bioreactor metagenome]|uniref:Uncharacterized protein n=1 Tax=bioreactor metagenome TaxID=1076179 RepID=A0A645IDR6_9ZZZZ
MAYIRTDGSRVGQSDLRIHIGAVHINLTAVFVYDAAHFFDTDFENSMCRRIGNHTAQQNILVLYGFFFPVVQIHVAVFVAFHHHDV